MSEVQINQLDQDDSTNNQNQESFFYDFNIPDGYKFIKMIAKGSYGYVFLVKKIDDGSVYVIKNIPTMFMSEKEKRQSQKEYIILKKLIHPNIIKFKEARNCIQKHMIQIVMEYAEGGDLHQKIQRQKNIGKLFSEEKVLDWFIQICLALEHLHTKKIIHRDIKPKNIFLTQQNCIKLGDFGVSKELEYTKQLLSSRIGTPYYIAPEVSGGIKYSYEADIWSLGVVLYELCCLQPPFQSWDQASLYFKTAKKPYPPITHKEYSNRLKTLVSKLLIKSQNERYTLKQILNEPIIYQRLKQLLENTEQKRNYHPPQDFRNPNPQKPQLPKRDQLIPNLQQQSPFIKPIQQHKDVQQEKLNAINQQNDKDNINKQNLKDVNNQNLQNKNNQQNALRPDSSAKKLVEKEQKQEFDTLNSKPFFQIEQYGHLNNDIFIPSPIPSFKNSKQYRNIHDTNKVEINNQNVSNQIYNQTPSTPLIKHLDTLKTQNSSHQSRRSTFQSIQETDNTLLSNKNSHQNIFSTEKDKKMPTKCSIKQEDILNQRSEQYQNNKYTSFISSSNQKLIKNQELNEQENKKYHFKQDLKIETPNQNSQNLQKQSQQDEADKFTNNYSNQSTQKIKETVLQKQETKVNSQNIYEYNIEDTKYSTSCQQFTSYKSISTYGSSQQKHYQEQLNEKNEDKTMFRKTFFESGQKEIEQAHQNKQSPQKPSFFDRKQKNNQTVRQVDQLSYQYLINSQESPRSNQFKKQFGDESEQQQQQLYNSFDRELQEYIDAEQYSDQESINKINTELDQNQNKQTENIYISQLRSLIKTNQTYPTQTNQNNYKSELQDDGVYENYEDDFYEDDICEEEIEEEKVDYEDLESEDENNYFPKQKSLHFNELKLSLLKDITQEQFELFYTTVKSEIKKSYFQNKTQRGQIKVLQERIPQIQLDKLGQKVQQFIDIVNTENKDVEIENF
ncbi:hypothetical protein ABPG72_002466 [Tetrahymena utriculariae]